jgi:serpin B
MTVRGEYRATERGGTKAIEIPFVGDEVAMVVLLPKNAPGLQRLERELTPAEFARWVDRLEAAHSRNTVLTLPRMRLRWRQDLASTLSAMGAPTPFGDDAGFSGIAAMPYPGEIANAIGLKIKRVIHQTFFDLDEHGAEAAAATAVVMEVVVSGRSAAPPPPFVFRADHPFLFMLRDRRTGAILFMGRYVTPEAH